MCPKRCSRFGAGVLLAAGVGVFCWLSQGQRPNESLERRWVQVEQLGQRLVNAVSGVLPAAGSLITPGGQRRAWAIFGDAASSGRELEYFDPTQRPIPGQTIVRFASLQDLQAFMRDAARLGLRLGAANTPLLMVKVYGSVADLELILPSGAETSPNYPIRLPEFDVRRVSASPQGVQEGGLLAMIGAENRPEHLGEGVRIAILDTGLPAHADLRQGMTGAYNHVESADGPEDRHGHGTEVASVLFSKTPEGMGITPHAIPEYHKILDDRGQGNAYDMARAIVQAVDDGVSIINLSVVTYEDDPSLRAAVEYAERHGVLLVAPAGNDATTRPAYPGAYDSVICFAGSDDGFAAIFSNQGDNIDYALPSVWVPVRNLHGAWVPKSGTSYSSAMGAGVLAAAVDFMGSQRPMNPTQGNSSSEYAGPSLPADAQDFVSTFTNDLDAPGHDASTGDGEPSFDRLFKYDVLGWTDMAVTSIRVPRPSEADAHGRGTVSGTNIPVQVVVQNQGNEVITDASVRIQVRGSIVEYPLETALGPNDVASVVIDLPPNYFSSKEGLNVAAQVQVLSGVDYKDTNDSWEETFILSK